MNDYKSPDEESKEAKQGELPLKKFEEYLHPITQMKFTSDELYRQDTTEAFQFWMMDKFFEDREINFLAHQVLKTKKHI